MTYKLGIDVGSTTLKAVVLNDQDEIVSVSYTHLTLPTNSLV